MADPRKPEEQKLSPAELKKKAKADKQARRAAAKDGQGASSTTGGDSSEQPSGSAAGKTQQQKVKGEKQQAQQKGAQEQGESSRMQTDGPQTGGQQAAALSRSRTNPQNAGTGLPSRTRADPQGASTTTRELAKKEVQLFSHLYSQPRRETIEGASKDVHPAVLALGFQMSGYEICGSTARTVAMLCAFKEAIQEYITPGGTSLARHMTAHYLSPQIDFLRSCRPISESMGNAIRWLKKLIVQVDPDTPEQEAKATLCDAIDRFIYERILTTAKAIAASASEQIKDGSVVLTYAKSNIVEKTILQAKADGKKFRVMVVDTRPLYEGRKLALSLANAGVEVEYVPFSGISWAVTEATVVLLGAHSMLSNGRLLSRVGVAALAMAAHRKHIPVIVCCASVKFSGKVALDSVVLNEVAPPEELIMKAPPSIEILGSADVKKGEEEDDKNTKRRNLHDWREIPNLQILNLMYDVTPAEYISMIIREYGNLPPSSVPVVHRLANEGM